MPEEAQLVRTVNGVDILFQPADGRFRARIAGKLRFASSLQALEKLADKSAPSGEWPGLRAVSFGGYQNTDEPRELTVVRAEKGRGYRADRLFTTTGELSHGNVYLWRPEDEEAIQSIGAKNSLIRMYAQEREKLIRTLQPVTRERVEAAYKAAKSGEPESA